MFYTLITKFIIQKTGNDMDMLYIFAIGSIAYVILHGYLYSDRSIELSLITKARDYLYYAMALDIVTCSILYKMMPDKQTAENNNETNEFDQEKPLTQEQRKLIFQRMQEAKRLQQNKMRNDDENEDENKNENDNENNDEHEDENANKNCEQNRKSKINNDCSEKKTIFAKSNESVDSNKKQKNNENESVRVDDTEIPLFNEVCKNEKEKEKE